LFARLERQRRRWLLPGRAMMFPAFQSSERSMIHVRCVNWQALWGIGDFKPRTCARNRALVSRGEFVFGYLPFSISGIYAVSICLVKDCRIMSYVLHSRNANRHCHFSDLKGMITDACGLSRPSSRSASVANPATAHRFISSSIPIGERYVV